MKAHITKIRLSASPFEKGIVVEFRARNMPHLVLVYPGDDLKARMRESIANMRAVREGKKEAKKLLTELKPLEGTTIDLALKVNGRGIPLRRN